MGSQHQGMVLIIFSVPQLYAAVSTWTHQDRSAWMIVNGTYWVHVCLHLSHFCQLWVVVLIPCDCPPTSANKHPIFNEVKVGANSLTFVKVLVADSCKVWGQPGECFCIEYDDLWPESSIKEQRLILRPQKVVNDKTIHYDFLERLLGLF